MLPPTRLRLPHALSLFSFLAMPGCADIDAPEGNERISATTDLLSSCTAAAIRQSVPAARRNTIMRGLHWADPASPVHAQTWYDQEGSFEGYRKDCSGFVSMAWGLPRSETTESLRPEEYHRTRDISWRELVPGDALLWRRGEEGHVMLFAGWIDEAKTQYCVLEEYTHGVPASVRFHDTKEHEGEGDYQPIRYDGAGAVGPGKAPQAGPPSTSCYSETRDRYFDDAACVQSKADEQWYQCDRGTWVSRWGNATQCASEFPVAAEGVPVAKGCHSDTLDRGVADNACVQSEFDGRWYQCDDGNWVDRASDPNFCTSYWAR